MLCAVLYAGGCGRWALIAGGARGAGGDAFYAGGCGRWALLRKVSEVLQVPEVMRCVRFCMPEGVEGGLCLLEELEAMRCMLKSVEGRLCLRRFRRCHSCQR